MSIEFNINIAVRPWPGLGLGPGLVWTLPILNPLHLRAGPMIAMAMG